METDKYEPYYSKMWFGANEHRFDEWFDLETFDWDCIELLIVNCSNHFGKWYRPGLISDLAYSQLAKYCPEHFASWWNHTRFDYQGYSKYLAQFNSKNFNVWWNPDKFDWYMWCYLKDHCIDRIDVWYCEERLVHTKQEIIVDSMYA